MTNVRQGQQYWSHCGFVTILVALCVGGFLGLERMLDALVVGGYASLISAKSLAWFMDYTSQQIMVSARVRVGVVHVVQVRGRESVVHYLIKWTTNFLAYLGISQGRRMRRGEADRGQDGGMLLHLRHRNAGAIYGHITCRET